MPDSSGQLAKPYYLKSLSLLDLSHTDIKGAILGGSILRGANLEGANFREVDLSEAGLEGANLEGADLEEVDLLYICRLDNTIIIYPTILLKWYAKNRSYCHKLVTILNDFAQTASSSPKE